MSFLHIYFSEDGFVNMSTITYSKIGGADKLRKRASEVLWAEMIGVLLRMPESNWNVKITFNIAGTDFSGVTNVIGLLIKFLKGNEPFEQNKYGCVVKLHVMFKSTIETNTVEAIHNLIIKLPNLNHIGLQTYIEWDKTFKYIIEESQLQSLSLILVENHISVFDHTHMITRIVDMFKRANSEGGASRITKLMVEGQHVSVQPTQYAVPVGKILQNCPQLHIFSIYSNGWLPNLVYFAGHRFELEIDHDLFYKDEMQNILTWANASQTLKVIKFINVEFHLDSIAALRADIEKADIEKDKYRRTCIQKLIFVGCTPTPECEAIKEIMDYRNKALELASFGKEKNIPPAIVQHLILNLLGLKLDKT